MDDLMERLLLRDEQGIAVLKEEYGQMCYSIIYRLLRDHEQTEEALSDVWLQIWNSIPQARPAQLRAYVAKSARNTAIHYVKRNTAQKRSGITVLLDELEECIPDPRWQCDGEELKEMLRSFLSSLEAEERRVFLRRYWYGDTVQEIAMDSHCTANRIAGVLFRTRNKLRKYLKSEGYEI